MSLEIYNFFFAVVSMMNGKYKWIVNESRRLHEAGVAPAVCDKILYEHAIELVSQRTNMLISLT